MGTWCVLWNLAGECDRWQRISKLDARRVSRVPHKHAFVAARAVHQTGSSLEKGLMEIGDWGWVWGWGWRWDRMGLPLLVDGVVWWDCKKIGCKSEEKYLVTERPGCIVDK